MASLHTWYRYEQMECWDLSTFCWRNSYSVACSFQLSSIFLLNLYGHSKFEMKIIAWSDEGSLTFTVFLLSLVLMTYVLSQSLPWDRNYEWIATFKILDSCPVISCVAVWKVLKLKILLHSSLANHVRVKYCSQNITTYMSFLIVWAENTFLGLYGRMDFFDVIFLQHFI